MDLRPAPLLPLALLLLVMLLPIASAFVFANITITTFSVRAPAVVEQSMKFAISATIGVSGATYPIYVYLVANNTIWGSPIVTNITGVNTYTYIINFPVPPGTYVIYFLIVDSAGYAARTPNFTLRVVPRLGVSVMMMAPPIVENMTNVTMIADISGGVPPYYITWFVNGTPYTINATELPLTLTTAGKYNVSVVVRDSMGMTATSGVLLTVLRGPTVTAVGPGEVDVNSPVNVTVAVAGGHSPYQVYVYLNGSQVAESTAKAPGVTTLSFTPTRPGHYVAEVVLRDAFNGTAYAFVPITVNPGVSVSVTPVSVGNYLVLSRACYTLRAVISGGTPPYSVTWYVDGTPQAYNTTVFRTCFFNTRANLISVSVSDRYGRTSTAGLYVKASLNLVDIIIAGVAILIAFLVFKAVTSWYPRYLPY
jgi:thermopsin